MAPSEPPIDRGSATLLLQRMSSGEVGAADQLLELVHGELHRLAEQRMRGQRGDHTLQPTALVNEVYLRLVDLPDYQWESRAQFFGLAARAMHRILVDHARRRASEKQGGGRKRITLDKALIEVEEDGVELLALEVALERLAAFDERMAQIVELRFFAGIGHREVAEVLGTSTRTVEREWRLARAWLRRALRDGPLEVD